MPDERPVRIRSFIAILVPLEIIENVVRVQKEVQQKGNTETVRWTRPEQMHLTVKFLGDIPHERLSTVENALGEAVVGSPPFSLSLEGFGCFPSALHPSVFWAGLGGQVEALKQLQKRIEARTNWLTGHEEDREFHPHLTIGRARTRGPETRRIAEALVQHQPAKLGQWIVSEITLMKSNLSPRGAIHTQLAVVKLTG